MKVQCKHLGTELLDFGYDNISVEEIREVKEVKELNERTKEMIIKSVQFRPTEEYDFEYGIGGSVLDEYYKVKDIQFRNNLIEIEVKRIK